MYSPELTWGDARKFHQLMEMQGMTSPDDLLANPKYAEMAVDQPDEALVFPPEDEVKYRFTAEETKDGKLLELLMTDEVEGIMYYRSGGEWVAVKEGESAPTIYEVPMHEVKADSIEDATAFWDDKENADDTLRLEDVESHLA